MSKQNLQITKKGYEALEKELDQLVNTKRPKLVERLSRSRREGDLSENSDYANARDDLEFLDGRISELEDFLKNAEIVKTNGGTTQVSLGNTVKVKVGDNEQIYFIVGEWEADPNEKKISHTSPLGQALVGKKVGDKTEVEAPVGKLVYEVVSIE